MSTISSLSTQQLQQLKGDVRSHVWEKLKPVAYPDSRFHWNFAEFIADFQGSEVSTDLILGSDFFRNACEATQNHDRNLNLIFVTPDNCLESLRYQLLRGNIPFLMTTYGIRRGFYLLDPSKIDSSLYKYASTLDGMERCGQHVSLAELKSMNVHVPLMITGTGAINEKGIRFGKGHGFFDLEWAMLSTIGCIDIYTTKCVAVVHDVQLLEGVELKPEVFDTVCDYIVTNSRLITVENAVKPTCGVLWDALAPGMLEDIEPLAELRQLSL